MLHIKNIKCKYIDRSVWWICFILFLLLNGCKKFVTVDQVPDNILSSEIYNSSESANSGINGIYRITRDKIYTQVPISLTIQTGLYADELSTTVSALYLDQYIGTNLLPNSTDWSGYFSTIYACNAAIDGLNNSKKLLVNTKQQYIGEAKFLRALSYFYLVNLYGDVPLILNTEIQTSSQAARSRQELIYSQAVNDLVEALDFVRDDYSISNGDKVRANKATIKAFLARLYLYQKNYQQAEFYSNQIIESGKYSLVNIQSPIFSKNNSEAIFQLDNSSGDTNEDAVSFLFSTSPTFVITESLAKAFEQNDQRKAYWFKPYTNNGLTSFIPNKFTITAATSTELNTPFRLAEQYLIRGEARIQLGKISDGISDLNVLRARASLPAPNNLSTIPVNLSKDDALLMVEKERRLELSAELGNRFFDLKRNGRINNVMTLEKPTKWKTTSSLFPIPQNDILRNSNLTQNPGY